MEEGRLRERKKESNGSYILETFVTPFALKAFKVGVKSFKVGVKGIGGEA